MNGNKSKLVSVSVRFIDTQNVFWLGGGGGGGGGICQALVWFLLFSDTLSH